MKLTSKHFIIAGGTACMYTLAYFLFMPAYEIDRGFDKLEIQRGNVQLYIRLTGTQTETGSRLLNRIYNDNPYLLQFGIKQSNDFYETVKLVNLSIYDKTIEKPAYEHQSVLPKQFSKYANSQAIAGYAKEGIILDKENYSFKTTFELCNKLSCDTLEFTGTLNYREKKSFYSDSFANMMGI